jgi:formate dehydrogenase gamma subunit
MIDGYVRRFSSWARIQHLTAILCFGLLVLTGMPQKWPYLDVSNWVIDGLGGLLAVRWLHRVIGILFAALLVAHLSVAITGVVTRRVRPSMVLSLKDFRDTLANLRYYAGYAEAPPKFGRYDYRQKFEYWGLLFGGAIMVVSGFILYFPVVISRILPAELIPVAKVTHSYEALLAVSIVVVWHIAGALLTPEAFPLDTTIFTGKISKERMRREHTLEYEELFRGE